MAEGPPPTGSDKSAENSPGTLLAASLLAAVLGSVHAFSVFLALLEAMFGQTRSMVSLTYSIALVALTLAVLWGHRWYGRWTPARFVLGLSALGAAGALAGALAPALPLVWLGYSVMFGAANGLGYGFGLQIAAQSNPGREGLAMGTVTAAYALGAVISPALFSAVLTAAGFRMAMLGLMAALILAGIFCAALMRVARARFRGAAAGLAAQSVPWAVLSLFWLGYGAGVATGLMTIGHASGIASAAGYAGPDWRAPAVVAICNLAGSLIAGRLANRIAPLRLLVALPLISALAAFLLSVTDGTGGVMLWLGLIGFAYGAIIAAYPAAIAKSVGMQDGPRVYGRVFTAWGMAGLLGPWLAGGLFDLTGTYRVALMVAGSLGVVSAMSVLALARRTGPRPT